MSRINSKSGQGSALATAVGALRSTIDAQGTDLSSRQITQQVISMESLDAASLGELTRTADMLKGEIKNALSVSMESDEEGEELTDAQLEAGAIAAMAAGAPAEYADIALRSAPAEGGERLEVATSGAAGSGVTAGLFSGLDPPAGDTVLLPPPVACRNASNRRAISPVSCCGSVLLMIR